MADGDLWAALPDHPWSDPDGDGHNCDGCPPESLWKCDQARHPAPAAPARPAGPDHTDNHGGK